MTIAQTTADAQEKIAAAPESSKETAPETAKDPETEDKAEVPSSAEAPADQA